MICKKPFKPRGVTLAVPCGQCMPCRFNRRNIWGFRMMLEALTHSDSAFVTLTYDDEKHPLGGSYDLSSLVPKDLQDWLKRLRKDVSPRSLRYYACGEYGTEKERPHFHAIVFGLPSCSYGRSRYGIPHQRVNCCYNCDLVRDSWGHGRVHLDQVNEVTSAYVAGYVAKGLTKRTGRSGLLLAGRHPEFSRMSLRPGIGSAAISILSKELFLNPVVRRTIESAQSVPSVLRSNGKLHPIGRYLKEKLHGLALHSGLVLASPGHGPQAETYKAQLRALWKNTQADSPLYVSLEQAVLRHYQGKRDAFESRASFSRGRLL